MATIGDIEKKGICTCQDRLELMENQLGGGLGDVCPAS